MSHTGYRRLPEAQANPGIAQYKFSELFWTLTAAARGTGQAVINRSVSTLGMARALTALPVTWDRQLAGHDMLKDLGIV